LTFIKKFISHGRILCENYFIEMCDNSIPITFVANNQFKECSFDSNVILEVNSWWK
jgi:hypothetical protein